VSKRCAVVLVLLGALVLLAGCSSGGSNSQSNPTAPLVTLRPPPASLPPGVSQVCAEVVDSVMRTIVGPFHGAVPSSEYQGTPFAAILAVSLNNCSSHIQWTAAAVSAVGSQYRVPLERVYQNACAVARNALVGGSGPVSARLPRSCRNVPVKTTTTTAKRPTGAAVTTSSVP
jgi:hypothetical protein